jgi:hypothetical protein
MTSPQYLTGCELRTLDLTNGDQDYVWVDFEDARQQDITGDTVMIALGTYDAPGAWVSADLIEQNGAVWKIRAALFITAASGYPLGSYWLWIKVGDNPAIIVRRADNRLVQLI